MELLKQRVQSKGLRVQKKNPGPRTQPPATLESKDKKFIWHPFTQMQDWEKEDILIIQRGKGIWLEDIHGKKYLDGVSSLWCNVHGHQVPEIDRAVQNQLKQIAHSTFLGLSNTPAILLAEELIKVAPKGLTRVFYSDSGSEAVEIALKMAYQFWQQTGFPKKKKFVRLSEAYHGDTLGSVSVGGIELFHQVYQPLLFQTFAVPTPYVYRSKTPKNPEKVAEESLKKMEEIFKQHHEEIAALVMEPLIQGAAGMITQPKGFISGARQLTKKYNILLVFDEVATGFGRTGSMFACQQEKVVPDILTAAKGLTGGYLPLAATFATEKIYKGFLGKYEDLKTFFHGHTYTANPLACAAALANLKLFRSKKLLKNLQPKIRQMEKRLKNFYQISIVGNIRQCGFMAGIELVQDPKSKKPFDWKQKIGIRVIEKAREKGAILRPLGPVVVLMPPLAISKEELDQLLDITYQAIEETAKEL